MNEERIKPGSLAARREALVHRCADQRDDLANQILVMTAPLGHGAGGLRHFLAGRLKLPLTIAGVALGMVAVRPRRALPLLGTALSLWKVARPLLALFQRDPAAHG